MTTSVAANLASIRRRLGKATLIAVSKTQPIAAIREALEAEQRVFGENRVQEAQKKFPPMRVAYPDIELHLIGALQTNKAVQAVDTFDTIQTLDRPQLAAAIAKAIRKLGKTPKLYIEINIGEEPQKAGIDPARAENFLALCRDSHGLLIDGLMCIPPENADPKNYFLALRNMAQKLSLPHISMGMSSDFETAIACGATEVRIGTAIFGKRQTADSA